MADAIAARVQGLLAECPAVTQRLTYGTAGFRADARLLDAVFVKMGVLAALRSMQTELAVGVMVTASHNPVQDNGVKMIDPDGGMLARAWEGYACELADASAADLPAVLASIAARAGVTLPPARAPVVHVAVDTRPSSAPLCARARAGAEALGAAVAHEGTLTTPQLHHIVRMSNFPHVAGPGGVYRGESGYYRMLADGFDGLTAGVSPASLASRGPLHVDCAHGVGGPQARKLAEAFKGRVELILSNTGEGEGEGALLNEGVGAEHCQKGRLPPAGFTAATHAGARCASLDGDADRLVYHTFAAPATAGGAGAATPVWRLLDGDKIAVLSAAWLGATLKEAGFVVTGTATHGGHRHGDAWAVPPSSGPLPALSLLTASPLSVGIVQTAYANGAASHHVRAALNLPCLLAKTGVKYVHAAAAAFDVGVYFEANGHGTVLMHPSFLAKLQAVQAASDAQLEEALGSAGARAAARRLAAGSVLINQAIGDALSDAMFVEAALASLGWGVADWDALYEDLPSRQAKLPVADRSAVRTVEDESRLTAPLALQEAIDALVAAVPSGRAFVRPSGTEDVVRVYAEGADEAAADALALAVSRAVYDHAGGVGARP